MKVVILAGGLGTRISEESYLKPKPMIEIGEKPILWHIMKIYSSYGFNDFIICCGYKSYVIKEYFADYYFHNCDVTFDFKSGMNEVKVHSNYTEPWKITIIDTGLNTMTGGRIKRVQSYVGEEDFMLTYGDGVSNININSLLDFHKKHGKAATMTAVKPKGKYGVLEINNNEIIAFREKDINDTSWVNGGFMILSPHIFKHIEGDETILEKEPLENLALSGQLIAYKHEGFWQCMDTQRDKYQLEEFWNTGRAPWKSWMD